LARRWIQLALFVDLSLWLGAGVYFTFFAANELFSGLSQDAFGTAIGLLFPSFFRLSTLFAILAVVLYATFASLRRSRPALRIGYYFAILGCLCALVNLFYFLPLIQHIEIEMGPYSTGSAALKSKFGMMHGISMLIELISIVSVVGVWACLSWCIPATWSRKESHHD